VVEDAPDSGEILMRDGAEPWDGLRLHVIASSGRRSGSPRRRLDNLGKGASGAAVQSLNLISGLPETAGLRL
jgi:N-acetyl-gamma-glutamyl-phosphate reductase